MNPALLQQKIEQLKEKFINGRIDAKEAIASWEKSFKKAMRQREFAEHPVIQEALADLEKRIEAINQVLLLDEKMTEDERRRAFARREAYEWFSGLFNKADKRLEALEQMVDEQLK